ncbi:hypothetical protein [Asanoa sp. NPDC050611]|uniref:hypothetical protein n=1 Tax=Asanoa sp. NPDC050611 TaxID=3157098 RepID=UPI0034112932
MVLTVDHSVRCPGTSDARAGGVITLTSAAIADLLTIRSWPDLAAHLSAVHARTGMSYTDLQRIGKARAKADPRSRELPTSTVSDVLSGKRPVKKDFLESLLAAWQVPADEHRQIVEVWRRINAAVGQGPANSRRFDEASPRELGVHPAISTGDASDDLPGYVPRDFDERLHDLIGRGVERGKFILLMGASSCGKTRSLFEAVRNIVPDWWVVQPTRTQEIHELTATPTERTVLWLDDLHRYLGTDPPLRKSDIVSLVRAGILVVGTLWPTHYFARKQLRQADGTDTHADDRLLLEFADVIPVPDVLSGDERHRAGELATTDSRIGIALTSSDAGLTQVLAAGPDLVNSWEQAPDPYGKAIISAAADARRLGVQGPLTAQLLTEAMAGYLSPAHRVAAPSSWLDRALRHATADLHGAVSALTPVAGQQGGSVDGYMVADYLTQHLARIRRVECPPHSLWAALVTHVRDANDLRRLSSSALARMRYRYAEAALDKLRKIHEPSAVVELITLLRRQDRLVEALGVAEAWLAAAPQDDERRALRANLVRLQTRAEEFRGPATENPRAAELLAELLADGGRADALRTRAATGDAVASEDLAELLADRGCLDELRERANSGQQVAAARLAELLATLGRVDELGHRAESGDQTAARHLAWIGEANTDLRMASYGGLAELRAAADRGNEEAATDLTAALFEAGDHRALLDEVNAGTQLAVERYLALLCADPAVDGGLVRQIRAFGLGADGSPDRPGASG